MKKLLLLISIIFTSFLMVPDSYEDEVRKRLGLLKDVPVVSMPGMTTDDSDVPVGRSGEAVYNLGCAACHTAGLAGAPMLGNLDQWTDRTSKGWKFSQQTHTTGTMLCLLKVCAWIVLSLKLKDQFSTCLML